MARLLSIYKFTFQTIQNFWRQMELQNIRQEELTKRDSMVVLLLKVKILVINDFAFEHLFAINYGLRQ